VVHPQAQAQPDIEPTLSAPRATALQPEDRAGLPPQQGCSMLSTESEKQQWLTI
jgi:hypothetical protein